MRFCFTNIRVFWVIAFLLMAISQATFAYQDLSCFKDYASELHDSTQQQDCLADHSCCPSHSHETFALAEALEKISISLKSNSFYTLTQASIEEAIREIEYPPQLS